MVSKPLTKRYVLKRDGRKEEVHLDKITSRIQKLCYGLNMDFIDPLSITLKVINGLYTGVTTVELDMLAAEAAAMMTTEHADYAILATRIAVTNLHKETRKQFSEVIDALYKAEVNGQKSPLISEECHKIIMENADRLNSCIVYNRDFSYSYFSFKLLEELYLLKLNGKIAERPQHLLMRVAVGIHGSDIDAAIETYNYLSEKYFIHASPALFSAATARPQLSSSFSLMMPADSIEGIFKCVAQCADVSESAGSISVNIHNIRAAGTRIAGTNGVSNGLVPMLRVFNNAARFVGQNDDRRPSPFTIYLEPWHADIYEFLVLKKNTGKDELRARDLFYALWIPDLFMKRVETNGMWSLMCPHKSKGLSDCWGVEFERLYEKYEAEGKYVSQMPAQKLWQIIYMSQVETGMPFILYKDACNRKSNQQNLGTIKSGSLSADVIQHTSPEEIAACNFASIAVNMFVKPDRKTYDFENLKCVTKVVVKNLNKIIDINNYPLLEARTSSLRHRPIGIGVQGLADAFILMRLPFNSKEAQLLNRQIFETLYYGALEGSSEIAEYDGSYSTYEGSPVSKGILQYDMWGVKPTDLWDWPALKAKISKYGIRNSLLLASMPTEIMAQILGNNESIEPYASNVDTRRVSSGELQIVNHHLLRDLTDRGLWNDDIKNQIIASGGSIQNITGIPEDLKQIYKTVWEVSNKVTINLAADRGAFIDQSQSLNIHMENSSYSVLSSIHFYTWRQGLKTGMYFLRFKPVAKAVQLNGDGNKVTVSNAHENGNVDENEKKEVNEAALMCSLQNPKDCEMCGA